MEYRFLHWQMGICNSGDFYPILGHLIDHDYNDALQYTRGAFRINELL